MDSITFTLFAVVAFVILIFFTIIYFTSRLNAVPLTRSW